MDDEDKEIRDEDEPLALVLTKIITSNEEQVWTLEELRDQVNAERNRVEPALDYTLLSDQFYSNRRGGMRSQIANAYVTHINSIRQPVHSTSYSVLKILLTGTRVEKSSFSVIVERGIRGATAIRDSARRFYRMT